MIALLQVLDRGQAPQRARGEDRDPGARGEPGEDGVLGAVGAVQAVERVDEEAHRHAARRGLPEGRGDLARGGVVLDDVDLQVDALARAAHQLEQRGAGDLVVEGDAHAVAGRGRAAGGDVEAGAEAGARGRRLDEGGGDALARGGQVGRAERREADREHALGRGVDDRVDARAGEAEPGGDAAEPHRVDVGGHVRGLALVEHAARVEDQRPREARRREPRAQRREAVVEREADAEQEPVVALQRGPQLGEHAGVEARVEEDQAPGAEADQVDARVNRREGIGGARRGGAPDADRGGLFPRAERVEIEHQPPPAQRADQGDAAAGDDREMLIGQGRRMPAPAQPGDVEGERAPRHRDVGRVEAGLGPRLGERRHEDHRQLRALDQPPPRPAREPAEGPAAARGEQDHVGAGARGEGLDRVALVERTGREPRQRHRRAEPRDRRERLELGLGAGRLVAEREHGDAQVRAAVIAQERGDRREQSQLAVERAKKVRDARGHGAPRREDDRHARGSRQNPPPRSRAPPPRPARRGRGSPRPRRRG